MTYGNKIEGIKYGVLDERVMRASAGLMIIVGLIAMANGFFLQQYAAIPYLVGFILLNFAIGVFVNPNYVPTMIIGKWLTKKQDPIYVGAIQKRFAWSLGMTMALIAFTLSLMVQANPFLFNPMCMLCMICLTFMFFESAFGICVGCKLYGLGMRLGLVKKPKSKEEAPKCIGDSCSVNLK